jgi:hypothetical protein
LLRTIPCLSGDEGFFCELTIVELPNFMSEASPKPQPASAPADLTGPQLTVGPLNADASRAGLLTLAFAVAVFNVLLFPLGRACSGDMGITMFVEAIGMAVLPGEVGALALWLVWGDGPFLPRLAIHWAVALGLLASLFVGVVAATAEDRFFNDIVREFLAIIACLLPISSLAAQLPLWPLRTHLRWRLERAAAEATAEKPQPLSILDILSGTAVVAVSLGLIRLAPVPEGATPFWGELAVTLLCILGVSLFSLLPASLFVMRFQSGGQGVAALAGYTMVVALGLLGLVAVLSNGGLPGEAVFVFLVSCFCFASTLAAPLVILRSCGHRLVRPRDAKTPSSNYQNPNQRE